MLEFIYDEKGSSSIEIAIISTALIALALVFRKQIMSLVKTIAEKIIG